MTAETADANWLSDANGNRCSISYWGSREAAQAALDSLKNCRDCTNCSGCSDCSRCSGCSGCSDCSGCSRCSDCSGCSRCSDCSGCSGCSRCSRCSHVAWLYDKRDIIAVPPAEGEKIQLGAPAVPVIEDIHQRIYEAASIPRALNMRDWHSCGTTHCRAGWVVHLAGEAGYALERFHNTPLAAQLIYAASGFEINPCRFYDGNTEALADMARLAGVEPEGAQ